MVLSERDRCGSGTRRSAEHKRLRVILVALVLAWSGLPSPSFADLGFACLGTFYGGDIGIGNPPGRGETACDVNADPAAYSFSLSWSRTAIGEVILSIVAPDPEELLVLLDCTVRLGQAECQQDGSVSQTASDPAGGPVFSEFVLPRLGHALIRFRPLRDFFGYTHADWGTFDFDFRTVFQ